MPGPVTRKKRSLPQSRAIPACNECRARKTKCSKSRPTCDKCKPGECTYHDYILPQKPSTTTEVPKRLIDDQSIRHEEPSRQLENLPNSFTSNVATDMIDINVQAPATSRPSRVQDVSYTGSELTRSDDILLAANSALTRSNDTGGESVVDVHDMSATKMIHQWPSIAKLTRGHFQCESKPTHALSYKARRQLHIDDAGERYRLTDQTSFEPGNLTGRTDMRIPVDPSCDSQIWTRALVQRAILRKSDFSNRTLMMDFSLDRIDRLMTCYFNLFHVMHPIVDLEALQAYRTELLRSSVAPLSSSTPNLRLSGASGNDCAAKRKKTLHNSQHAIYQRQQPLPCPSYDCSPIAAIFFLVLALGELSEHQGLSPSLDSGNIGTNVDVTARPICGLDPASLTAGSHVTKDRKTANLTSSCSSPGWISPTAQTSPNIEIIPGLAYYNEGMQILELYSDDTQITVAQGKILAGLYNGQLGRSQESWSWIYDAARIIRLQARLQKIGVDEAERFSFPHWGRDKSQLQLTYWTILQLERDILTELNYPASGLEAIHMPLPVVRGNPACLDERTMEYYYMRLLLHRQLHEIFVLVYSDSDLNNAKTVKSLYDLPVTLSDIEGYLVFYRTIQANRICGWDDNDLPADDILDAHLRAEFYEALCGSLRTFLDYTLHTMKHMNAGTTTVSACAVDAHGVPRGNQAKFFAAISLMRPDDIIHRARRCVQAVIRSILAFDHVYKRQIVTKIIGTCHTQSSNMLVLCACATSELPWLAELIPMDLMRRLLQRTIRFLSQLGLARPTVLADVQLLQHLYCNMFACEPISVPCEGQDYRDFDHKLTIDAQEALKLEVMSFTPLLMEGGVLSNSDDAVEGMGRW